MNAAIIRDAAGRPLEAVAVVRDVSHRREVERRLAESEEMYRNLLDNISEAVYKTDHDGTMLFISAGIEHITGRKPEEVVGRNFSEFIYPEDREIHPAEFGAWSRTCCSRANTGASAQERRIPLDLSFEPARFQGWADPRLQRRSHRHP